MTGKLRKRAVSNGVAILFGGLMKGRAFGLWPALFRFECWFEGYAEMGRIQSSAFKSLEAGFEGRKWPS